MTFIVDLFVPGTFISFGILCFMASAIFITIPIHLLLNKLKYAHWVGFFVCLVAFILLKNINEKTIIFDMVRLPSTLYQNYFTAYLGFPPFGFVSGDYFGIFPWIFLYLTGYFAFSIVKELDLLKYLTKLRCKPFEFVGRHSLIIYMVHQVALFPIAFVFSFAYQLIFS